MYKLPVNVYRLQACKPRQGESIPSTPGFTGRLDTDILKNLRVVKVFEVVDKDASIPEHS